jgi:hypothetical protein
MVELKRMLAILLIVLSLGVPIAWAALSPSFSDTVWQTPTIKADTYYLGASTNVTPILQHGATWIAGNKTAILTQVGGWIAGNSTTPTGVTLPSPSVDKTANGIKITITAGENLVTGNVVYLKSDGKYYNADSDASTTMPATAIALASISTNASGYALTQGFYRDDAFSLTPGALIYVSGSTGSLTSTCPTGSGKQVQILGYAFTSHIIYFEPNLMVIELS